MFRFVRPVQRVVNETEFVAGSTTAGLGAVGLAPTRPPAPGPRARPMGVLSLKNPFRVTSMKRLIFVALAVSASASRPSRPRLPRSSPEGGHPVVRHPRVRRGGRPGHRHLHSLMLVRSATSPRLVSPMTPTRPALYSLSKASPRPPSAWPSRRQLSVDDAVLKFFPADAPAEASDRLKAMRVGDPAHVHGHQAGRRREENWARPSCAAVPHKPGALYNTAATYVLSAIVQKRGGPLLDSGCGRAPSSRWGSTARAGAAPAGGHARRLRAERARDIARFGQLYLQKWRGGRWCRVGWRRRRPQRSVWGDGEQGYGYQFWRGHDAYRGDGAFGQAIVLPEQDAVVAITGGVKDMQAVLDLVWDKLLPAMGPAPLVADEDARRTLERRLAGLTLRPQEGSGSTRTAARVTGKTYHFPANDRKLEAITLQAAGEGDAATLVARFDGADRRIACVRGAWRKAAQ
ncbi:MAG: hypothetical protein WKF75_04370 [Singulisphaera sp.]